MAIQAYHIDLAEVLEQLVDQHGLLRVVTCLELVCAEKAQHLRSNWQDDRSAQMWDRAAAWFRRPNASVQALRGPGS
jgi:hypothetical protein